MENFIVCCVCKKIKYNGEWVEKQIPEEYIATHTYCPACYEQELKEINKYLKLPSKLGKSK